MSSAGGGCSAYRWWTLSRTTRDSASFRRRTTAAPLAPSSSYPMPPGAGQGHRRGLPGGRPGSDARLHARGRLLAAEAPRVPASSRRSSAPGTPPPPWTCTTRRARCWRGAARGRQGCSRRRSPTRWRTWTFRRRTGSACAPTTCKSAPTGKSSAARAWCRYSRRRVRCSGSWEPSCAIRPRHEPARAISRRGR